MSRIGLSLASAALSTIDSGLTAGKTLDLGVLSALIAGLQNVAVAGLEPSDNTVQAIGNLTGQLFPEASAEPEEAPPASDATLSQTQGEPVPPVASSEAAGAPSGVPGADAPEGQAPAPEAPQG